MFLILLGLYAIQVFYLMILNKKHGSRRERMGKKAVIVDHSMKRIKTASATHVDDSLEGEEAVGQKAFDDKTDWENEDFIYVY
jgi:hypothetical protein